MKHFEYLQHISKRFICLSVAGIVPIASFAVFTICIGGEALSGKIEDGHYYVRSGMPYKEVSFHAYVISAFLCLFASIGFFLIANAVLGQLEKEGFLESRKPLRIILMVFFGILCGAIAIGSLMSLAQALSH